MGILFWKKKTYYLFCVLAVLLVCMSGDLIIINEKVYSVFRAIWELPREAVKTCDITKVFDAGISGWFSLLLPVAALPFASCIADERKSGFYLYVKGRQSTFSYFRAKFCHAFASDAAVLLLGLGLYIAIIVCYFPLNPSYGEMDVVGGGAAVTVWSLCVHIVAKFVYFLLYGMVLSMLTWLSVVLYNDLCVDFCLVFLLNYMFNNVLLS